MSELFSQLGIDPKLLLAQGVNFVILLFVLTKFVYRPLAKMMEERRKKIELGIKGGEMAVQIIKDAENTKTGIIKEADVQAVAIISEAQQNAQKKAQDREGVLQRIPHSAVAGRVAAGESCSCVHRLRPLLLHGLGPEFCQGFPAAGNGARLR